MRKPAGSTLALLLLLVGVAQAKQNVRVLKADLEVAAQKVAKTRSELEYAKYQQKLTQGLAEKGAGPQEDAQKWTAQMKVGEATVKEALAEAERARLRYDSEIGSVNTAVATVQAELDQAALLPGQHHFGGTRGRLYYQPPGASGHGNGHCSLRGHSLLHLYGRPLPARHL